MRSLLFLITSLLIHFLVIVYAVLPVHIVPKTHLNNAEFTVRLVKKSLKSLVLSASQTEKNMQLPMKPSQMPLTELQQNKLKLVSLAMPSKNTEKNTLAISTGPTEQKAQTNNKSQAIEQAQYYAASQVDRRAMPQLGIDSKNLNSELSSGLPIKLRLYVNTFGRLIKIERIGVLDQDIPFVEQLEQQLYKLSFLPARRDNTDVDSYMDIEFSLNPLAPLEH